MKSDLGEGKGVKGRLQEGFLEEAINWDLNYEGKLDEQNLGKKI